MTRFDSENIKAAHTLRELGLDPETASDPVIRLIADRARLAAEVARLREALDAEREACARAVSARADMLEDAIRWGGSPKYLPSLNGGLIELRNAAAALRKGGAASSLA